MKLLWLELFTVTRSHRKYTSTLVGLLALIASGCTFGTKPVLPAVQTVGYVDVERYLGRWFEIASFPQWFAKGCLATTAFYSKTAGDASTLQVRNECRLESLDGKIKVATGVARIVEGQNNSKLRVSFFRPFYGDYWIIDLGQNYEFAVVGTPDRKSLWILSRTPVIAGDVYDGILRRASAQGFDVSRLVITRHLK